MSRVTATATGQPGNGSARHRLGVAEVAVGLLLLIGAFAGLAWDVGWVAQPFYAWVWWGYIVLLDGLNVLWVGDSLLTTRRRFLLPMGLWSISFWMFFELINSRIQNWYYVGVYSQEHRLAFAVFTVLAFSTVFIGIFQTYDTLAALRLFKGWKGEGRRVSVNATYGIQVLGGLMAGAALFFPFYLAPLIWGSFTFIVDPWNYRRGSRSLLRDFELGNDGVLARLLLAGLICGLVWESLNYLAPQKWIYTVRGLEAVKLFEMPLLGFLGFPALALDCAAGFALASSIFLGNRTWERSTDVEDRLRIQPLPRWSWFAATVPLQVAFWIGVNAIAIPINVGSVQVTLADLGLSAEEVRTLQSMDIDRPRQLIRRVGGERAGEAIRTTLGWSTSRMREIENRARLYTFKGIGADFGRLLERADVRTVEDLALQTPDSLLRQLHGLDAVANGRLPRRDFINVWILSSKAWVEKVR